MYEWFNEILPLMNTAGVADIAVLGVGPVATGVDLRTLFGNRTGLPTGAPEICTPSGTPNIDSGHFYTIKADWAGGPAPSGTPAPWRAYVAMASSVRAIDETRLGTSSGCCYPLLDGEKLRARMPPSAQDRATGVPSLFSAPVLNFKAPIGAGTGWLRIYRSSLGENQNPGNEWPRPGVRF